VTGRPGRVGAVDVHHHAVLTGYRAALERRGVQAQPGVPFPAWTPEQSLTWMERAGVERALLSVGSPGFHFGDLPGTVELTALCNAELAGLREREPARFGILAAVPLPDLAASLTQVERGLADGFDGVGLLTAYEGRLLGAPEWEELYALLDERGALVHVHPSIPCDWPAEAPVRPSLLEYPFETTRAIVELARHGVFGRYPRIRWVFSHGGGTLAALSERITGGNPHAPVLGGDSLHTVLAASRFDSALVGPAALAALSLVVGPERILYGSDLPFVDPVRVARERAALLELVGTGVA
jgi:predicted TIM-barrel fold metal-dependent hydrolase